MRKINNKRRKKKSRSFNLKRANLRFKERFFRIISKSATIPNPGRGIGDRANGLNTLACFSIHGWCVPWVPVVRWVRQGRGGRRGEGQRVEKHPGLYPQQCKAAQFCFRGRTEDTARGRLRMGEELRWEKKRGEEGDDGKGSGTAVGRKKRAREAAIF